jgi:hypothetical protein
MMRVGLACLVAGAVSRLCLSRVPGVTSALADGITGLMYGLAIGCLLVSLRSRSRPTPR